MSRHLVRLLRIDELLRSGQRQTSESLAKATEVSDRTARDDLAFLRDRYLAPLEYSKSRGWYYTDDAWCLPSVSVSTGELFALTLGAKMLQAYSGSTYQEELQSAIDRLAQRLPEQTWVDLKQLASERVLFRPGAELNLDPEIWQQLEFSCQNHRRVRMHYYTAGRNAHSERELDPYILHLSRNNPYVTGYCHTRKALRWFRVDRIKKLEVLDQTFDIDSSFNSKEHLETAFQHEVGGTATAISIWFDTATAPYIRERRWHSTQEIEEHTDGSLTLKFIARGLNEVKRWILFYGRGAMALEPPELVEMLRQEATALAQLYDRELIDAD